MLHIVYVVADNRFQFLQTKKKRVQEETLALVPLVVYLSRDGMNHITSVYFNIVQ
jgi:hypothetical protein